MRVSRRSLRYHPKICSALISSFRSPDMKVSGEIWMNTPPSFSSMIERDVSFFSLLKSILVTIPGFHRLISNKSFGPFKKIFVSVGIRL